MIKHAAEKTAACLIPPEPLNYLIDQESRKLLNMGILLKLSIRNFVHQPIKYPVIMADIKSTGRYIYILKS